MCGGTSIRMNPSSSIGGLSPRVRGNQHPRKHEGGPRGTIPACAGEPQNGHGFSFSITDYPRVCGGTHGAKSVRTAARGLSPRVRGNHSSNRSHKRTWRTIPACAGEPLEHGTRAGRRGDYPRVCGGTRDAGLEREWLKGLSPRVRGNPVQAAVFKILFGTIPACAGEPLEFYRNGNCLRASNDSPIE